MHLELLLRQGDGAGALHPAAVGDQQPSEHMEQSGLAAPVLTYHCQASAVRDGQVQVGQQGTTTQGDVDLRRPELGPLACRCLRESWRGRRAGRVVVLVLVHRDSPQLVVGAGLTGAAAERGV